MLRRSFRDYVQGRLNSPSREMVLEGMRVSYAASVAPDLALPYPHIAFPFPGKTPDSQAALLRRYENGFGGWNDKLSEYRARGQSLKAITLEYGGKEDFPWVRHGVEHVAGLMRAQSLPITLAVHSGGHESRLGRRLETAMLPAMANALQDAR